MCSINSVNTKLEAYLLIHDPLKLLKMLYSKYGDIEEDRDFFYINQILYNKKSAYNTLFKEYQLIYNYDDFLKRFYHHEESLKRIPKLSEYYKNYYLFFCKPVITNFKMTKIILTNGNHKAEIFYKKNYESLSKNDENESEKFKENSLYSFDNITNNNTIFDKKIRDIIENNTSKITLSLDNSDTNKLNNNLISKRSKDDSFIIFLNNLLKEKKANKSLNHKMNNLYFPQKHKFTYKNKIKSSIYNLSKNSYRNSYTIDKNKKSLSPSFYNKTNLNGFNKINPISKKTNLKMTKPRNSTYNNSKNLNSNLSNFEKLSSTITNNHHNNNISKTMRNSLILNPNYKIVNNQENNKISSRQYFISNAFSSTSNSKNKNKKNSNLNDKYSPFHNDRLKSNSNFINFNNNNTLKSKKRNYGSKFNLIKTPINIIQPSLNKETIKISNFSIKKNQTYFGNNKTNNNSNASLSLRKNKKKENKSITQDKHNSNNISRRKNKSNLDNLPFSNRKNLKSSINNKILYPQSNLKNYRIYMKLNNLNISSRNKKNSIVIQNETNIKSLGKEKNNSNSIDEDKMFLKNIISNLDFKKTHKTGISQKIINQLEELIKRSKFNYHNKLNNNTMSSPNLSNDKIINKKTIEGLRYNRNNLNIKKFKPINVYLNKNNKVNQKEKNEKINSPKK